MHIQNILKLNFKKTILFLIIFYYVVFIGIWASVTRSLVGENYRQKQCQTHNIKYIIEQFNTPRGRD